MKQEFWYSFKQWLFANWIVRILTSYYEVTEVTVFDMFVKGVPLKSSTKASEITLLSSKISWETKINWNVFCIWFLMKISFMLSSVWQHVDVNNHWCNEKQQTRVTCFIGDVIFTVSKYCRHMKLININVVWTSEVKMCYGCCTQICVHSMTSTSEV